MNATEILSGDTKVLYSYQTPVAVKNKDGIILSENWEFSNTTKRHVKEFLGLDLKAIRDAIKRGDINVVPQRKPKKIEREVPRVELEHIDYDSLSLWDLVKSLSKLEADTKESDGHNIWSR